MFTKAFNAISKVLLGAGAVLLTACYAPFVPDYPAMYAPAPAPKINRSVSGYVRMSADKTPVGGAMVNASYVLADPDSQLDATHSHSTATSKEGFYFIELENLPADEELRSDLDVTVSALIDGINAGSGTAAFTKDEQQEHIDLDIEVEGGF